MQEIITKIADVEKKIIGRIDTFSDDFSKHGALEIELFTQNKLRIDKLTETTGSMKKEYREKFKKLEKKILIMSIIFMAMYLMGIVINIIF